MSETTHTRTVALLPWHLNDSLDPGERREVEEHLESCADCRAELAETREAFALYGAHLPATVLVQHAEAPDARLYGAGGMRVERRAVDAHLDHCDVCRDELELARKSFRSLQGESADDDGETLATVTPFACPGEGPSTGDSVAKEAHGPPRWMPVALAASLLLAVIGAGGWGFTAQRADVRAEAQQQRIAELQELLQRQTASQDGPQDGVETADAESAEDGAAADDLQGGLGRELRDLRERYAQAEGRVASLDRQVAALRGGVPAGGVVYVPLEGGDVLRSTVPAEGGEVPEIALDGAGGVYLQPAVPADLLAAGGLTYRLRGPDGAILVEGPLPVIDETAQGLGRYVSLYLPAGHLPAGLLSLKILAGGETVGEHAFHVRR